MATPVPGILALGEEGKRVFVQLRRRAEPRPAVAVATCTLRLGISGEKALRRVGAVLQHCQHNHELIDLVRSLPQKTGSEN